MNSSQLTRRIQTRTVYADYIAQKERQAQGCATDTAYSQGGLNSSVLLEIQQGFLYTASTTTAEILYNAACPGCNNPPVPPPIGNGPPAIFFTAADSSYLGFNSPGQLQFGTNDFTVEWFQYMTSASQTNTRVFGIHYDPGVAIGASIEGSNDPRTFRAWYSSNTTFSDKTVAGCNYQNAWHHIAMVGSGGINLKVFLDGSNIMDETVQYDIGNDGNWRFTIGAEQGSNAPFPPGTNTCFDGYITNFRALNGTALYNGNFTVPSIPLGNITNTALLLLAENSNTAFVDSSSNNYDIQNFGNGLVSWSSSSPDFPF